MIHSPATRSVRAVASRAVRKLGALLLLALPATALAQLGAGVSRTARLEPTSTSTRAVAEFNAALTDIALFQNARAQVHLREAVTADPSLGLARVYNAFIATGMTTAQREEEMSRGIIDAARASTAEFVVASATRARFRREFTQAHTLLTTASEMLPNDPVIAHTLAIVTSQLPGNNFADALPGLRDVAARFPDYAPVYNDLSYRLYRTGDRAAAIAAARKFVTMAGNEPNPHDTYAELLQWNGRLDEARAEYAKALEIDATMTAPALGIAETRVIEGRFDLARAAITDVLPRVTVPGTRISYLRQVAVTYLYEGNVRQAMAQLELSMAEGTKNNLPNAVDADHVNMAITDALAGDGKSIATHLGALSANYGATDRAYYSGLAYALAKQNAAARTALADLRRVQSTPENAAMLATNTAVLEGLILVNEGNAAEAVNVIGRADLTGPLARAVLATAQAKAGNLGLARSLRDEILGDRAINLASGAQVTARLLVKRIN